MRSFDVVTMSESDLRAVLDLLERTELAKLGVPENIAGFFVARSNGNVVGCAGLERYGASGLVRSVAVDSARRGEGIAGALVRQILAQAARERLVSLYLLTTSARAYFERQGFEACPREDAPTGIRESWEFRTGCPASATFMRRAVSPR